MKKIFFTLLMLAQVVWLPLSAIIFRDQSSKIRLTNGSQYYQQSAGIITGTVDVSFDSSISTSSVPLYFRDGIYAENGVDLILTGSLDTSQTYSLQLAGSHRARSLFDANIRAKCLISGTGNLIEGRPKFLTADAIVLNDDATELYLGTQGDFASSILLNGGHVLLNNDFQLGEGMILKGEGKVSLRGNNIIFGTTETTWTSSVYWVNANNINLSGDTRLSGLWTFDGDATIIGGNHVLDLTGTGSLRIKENTAIEFNNLVIKGLGSGTIFCDDMSSILTFKNCVINLDRNYTVTSGQWIIAAPSKVIVGDHYLNFVTSSNLAVEPGSSLEYDTLSFNDRNNIVLLDENPVSDCGNIVFAQKLPLGPYRYTGDILLDSDTVVTELRDLRIVDDLLIDGDQFSMLFARRPGAPIFTLAANKKVTFTSISLKNFPVASDSVSFGSGSKIVFGDKTTVELGDSATLTTTWQCVGQTVIYGNGKVLNLGNNGNIVLSPGASILFDNITLDGVHGYNIKCMDDRCTITFGNVLWQQDGNYSFTRGKMYFRDTLELHGTATFNYATRKISTVASQGELSVGRGMTFNYNPPTADKSLLAFVDAKAVLKLDGCTLLVTTTGMLLTKGTLQVAGTSVLQNQGALSNSQALILGDGDPANDMTLNIAAGAIFDVQTGILLFNQQ
jgi:hypothetical protein